MTARRTTTMPLPCPTCRQTLRVGSDGVAYCPRMGCIHWVRLQDKATIATLTEPPPSVVTKLPQVSIQVDMAVDALDSMKASVSQVERAFRAFNEGLTYAQQMTRERQHRWRLWLDAQKRQDPEAAFLQMLKFAPDQAAGLDP